MENKKDWKYWLNEWESYLSTGLFIINTVLLMLQVITRYVFNYSITWLEEIATFLYVILVYSAVAAAVTHRKQICIDALPSALPFKAKKVLLIISDVIFFIFCIWIQKGLFDIVDLVGTGKTALLHIPYSLCYGVVAVFLLLTGVRCIQDIIRLWNEDEENLGKKKPTLDLEACEKEWEEKLRLLEEQNEGGEK